MKKLPRRQFEKIVREVALAGAELVVKKNREYAPEGDCLRNFRHGGTKSLCYRLAEKTTRLTTILDRRRRPRYDSIEDTIADLHGYIILLRVKMETDRR